MLPVKRGHVHDPDIIRAGHPFQEPLPDKVKPMGSVVRLDELVPHQLFKNGRRQRIFFVNPQLQIPTFHPVHTQRLTPLLILDPVVRVDVGVRRMQSVEEAHEVHQHGEPTVGVDRVFLPIPVHFVGTRVGEPVRVVELRVDSDGVGHVGRLAVEDVEEVLAGVVESGRGDSSCKA